MARVFVTGSSDGLGLMAARVLIEQGHDVVLHGRNDNRSRHALAAAPQAQGTVTGDLSTITGARTVADQVNMLGRFDAVIHNAGVGYQEGRVEAEPGVPSVFAVNVLAPYILTALIEKPTRLVYVSSGTHHGVRPRMDDLLWTKRAWSGYSAYAESRLCDVLLAFAVARRWKDLNSNALEPGWVPTKMGAVRRRTIFSKAVSPRRGSPRAKTSWRDRRADIFTISSPASPTRSLGTSRFRMSCWVNAPGFPASGSPNSTRRESWMGPMLKTRRQW